MIIGPIRKPGEGEQEAEATIGKEVQEVVGVLNQMREKSRQDLINQGIGQEKLGQGSYVLSGSEAKGPETKGEVAPGAQGATR